MTAQDVVALLAAADRTEVEVREPADGGRTVLRGAGTVDATLDDDGALVVRERGSWRRDGEPGATPYTDALRFRVGPGGARLDVEHLRRGEPVPLVALVFGADGGMRAEAPHVCGADEYTAELEAATGCVVLRWRVRGRAKDQEVVRTYRTPSFGSNEPAETLKGRMAQPPRSGGVGRSPGAATPASRSATRSGGVRRSSGAGTRTIRSAATRSGRR